ncbi:MarR family transcriptional regulator [Sphingomonas sp.]|uniref:MarR family winged helix-turn-helix transcriptional regulator n=1 Tax=Sphingomonas sp. TaxID=28214 RepID=UPI000DAFC2D4|nr:MarR family transcriptional regulator [Sphingomonas sp.]PZU08677.1 MAG: MarR family transcriptional regulator [Sphingomonas sp.]
MGLLNYTGEVAAVVNALRDFYQKSQLEMDRVLKDQGVSLARFRLLAFIKHAAPTRSVDVAEAFAYAPRTVTEALDGLERAGLIARRASPDDRRAKLIELTAEGEAALVQAEPEARRFVEDVFTALDDGEKATLAALVGKINARLSDLASARAALKCEKSAEDQ